MEKVKAVQVTEPEKLEIIEVDKPQLDETNNVLVKMKAVGLCGSDVGIYHGENAAATYPRIFGHEIVGEVVEAGPTAKKVKVGDRVILDQVVNCGHCWACRHNRPNVCGNLKVRGVHISGGMCEYIAAPDKDCYLVPDMLSWEEAVMIEPTTIGVQICSRAQVAADDMVLIIGAGVLGKSILQIAKLLGPEKLIVADIDDQKLKECLEMGATDVINSRAEDLHTRVRELTGGYGPTVVMNAAFFKGSLLNACQVAGSAARVMALGFSVEPDEINQFVIASKELDLRGSRLQNRKFQEVIDLINDGKIDLRGSISHTFNFLDAQKAFDFNDTHDPSIRKIVFTFDK